jgi:Xaa-Pro dipeptidase
MDTRLPAEFEHYRAAVALTDLLTRRALSNEVIRPGRTTVGDVRFWLLQKVNEHGLDVWFQPDLRVQRRHREAGKTQQFLSVAEESLVIERGDLLHVDFGLNYMGLSTDWQKHAYVLLPGERAAPAGLRRALANTNRLQDSLLRHARPGRSGAEVYEATMADMKREGIEAMIYSHSVGNQGHALGASIDFRSAALAGPDRQLMREGSYTAVELNTSTPVPEWGGQ